MKITKTASESKMFKNKRDVANIGCDKCPCCGETKSWTEYMKEGTLDKGIQPHYLNKTWVTGFFHMKNMKVDCYKCYTCGAEWESEPYKW